MVWLLVSLFGDGFVSHAVGTVAYRFTNGHSPAALQIFSSACSRCGKCVEVCPYAFRHYDLYMGLLRQVNRAQEGEEVRV